MKHMFGMTALSAMLAVSCLAADELVKPVTGTLDNLKTALKADVDAKARYEAFAVKAKEEGYLSVAPLFRAAAKSASIQFAKHKAALKALDAKAGVEAGKPEAKSTKENLDQMVKDMTALKDVTLPAFAQQAEADKNDKAAMSFKGAMASDAEYVKYAGQALTDLDGWKAAGKEFLVCTVCSWVTSDASIKQCPVCSSPREKFVSFK